MPDKQVLFVNVLLFGFYFPLLTSIALLIVYKTKLLYSYLKYKHKFPVPDKNFDELPLVTIQLPLYNEDSVVERLIASAIAIDYPKNKLEIQVLDDSTDPEAVTLSQRVVDRYRAEGYNIYLRHRTHRKDFKAGALAEGLEVSKGEYVAVFDSDFVIPANFLKDTVNFFTHPGVGMVQCRWGFINEKDSLLTRLQTTYLNGHFIIEHTARNRSGHFFNFNGTAGIWRKEAILSSGGWHGDTLTEDLDLSYRAQLKGWKFIYLKDLVAPSELPPTLDAFNGQQFRWVKGMVQVLFKMFPVIWRSKVSMPTKLDATCHLFSSAGYVFSVIISLITLPILIFCKEYIDIHFMWLAILFVFVNCFMIWLFYFIAEYEARGLKPATVLYPFLLLLFSIGFSLNGVYAIKEAILKKKSPFIRTPKFNQQFTGKIKSENNASPVYKATVLVAVYYLGLIAYIVATQKFVLVPAVMFFAPGYFWLIWIRFREKALFRSVSK
ncbi:MAG: glycosyltransferase [Fibrobacterota bacterium]